tara:strand:+ start:655 stop:1218 length:564 start_codon:yes stop_codon:yes gene_type:complete
MIENLTLANLISVLRIILVFPLIYLLQEFSDSNSVVIGIYSFLLILVIVVSDFLDGFVARKMGQITNLGKALDPIADKICMMAVLTFLTINEGLIFLLFFVLLSLRDIYIIIIVSYLINTQEEVFQSNASGKWFVGISALMMASYIYIDNTIINTSLYAITVFLMTISTYEYSKRYLKIFLSLDKDD